MIVESWERYASRTIWESAIGSMSRMVNAFHPETKKKALSHRRVCVILVASSALVIKNFFVPLSIFDHKKMAEKITYN